MAIADQRVTSRFAIYQADCIELMRSMPQASVHLSVYSPPFCGLYHYSSDDRDLSNSESYEDFFKHYEFVVNELARITIPGRMTAVHCMDVPTGNSGCDGLVDFPGDIIRLHNRLGWQYCAKYAVWKHPFKVRMRTMQKNLAHQTLVDDASRCGVASADYLVVFRRDGQNPIPIVHPTGLMEYAGERKPPAEVLPFRGHTGKQTENRYSHWIWRQYASAFWDDVRLERVLPFQSCREEDDEKHVHPLQLDVIERIVTLWSNSGEIVFTPFMGVGSEVYITTLLNRLGVGAELKGSYYRQAVKNVEMAAKGRKVEGETEELPFNDDAMDITDLPSRTMQARHPNTWKS